MDRLPERLDLGHGRDGAAVRYPACLGHADEISD
jgi:hypothetical protein